MIGERIRQARLLAGLTQDDVANRLSEAGYSATKAVISKYEKNKSVPNPTLLLALTQILGVETGYLLYEAETEVKWLAYRRHSALPAKAQEVHPQSQNPYRLHRRQMPRRQPPNCAVTGASMIFPLRI
jgi:transcriptional regulator with XRE-family HTH domain